MSTRKATNGNGGGSDSSVGYKQRRGPSWSRWIISNVLRLIIWSSVLTVMFRCPISTNEINYESPRICKPYFQARDTLAPRVRPYYDAYAAPYVAKAKPYTDQAYESVLLPSYNFLQHNYEEYGAPKIEQARIYSQKEWDNTIKPQLESGRLRVVNLYETSLGPHVNGVAVKLEPYYENARGAVQNQYETIILPTYERTRPYAVNAYDQGSHFASEVVIPYSSWAASNAATFLQRRVWPPVRILYGENVQPQLVKISERLANYREGKVIEAAVESEAESISSSSSASSTNAASQTSSPEDISGLPAEGSLSSSISSTTSSIAKASSTSAHENILDDLEVWKSKFNRAADEGAQGLRERIGEISEKQIVEQAQGTGEALVTSLEETARSAVSSLKSEILAIISAIPAEGSDQEDSAATSAKYEARNAIRTAGKRVKDNAQKLRTWRRSYNEEIQQMINAAADSTLDVVDSIREAGLQEIGMRWASMEGVTYKHWSEYHAMRKSFDQWRDTLQKVLSDHESPAQARKAAEETESRGMAVAEDAAKELSRLKEVALWKIDARDMSDDFSTRYMPPGAARAAQEAKEKVQEAVQGETSQGTAESLTSRASEAAQSVVDEGESIAQRAKQSALSMAEPAVDAASKASSVEDSLSSDGSSASLSASSTASSIKESVSSSDSRLSTSATQAAGSASQSLSSNAKSGAHSGSSEASNLKRSAEASVSSLADDSSSDSAERIRRAGRSAASSVKDASSRIDIRGTTVPGEDKEDTIIPIASVSESIASLVDQAGGDYASATKSIDQAEKMRRKAGDERESPVESLRESVSAAA